MRCLEVDPLLSAGVIHYGKLVCSINVVRVDNGSLKDNCVEALGVGVVFGRGLNRDLYALKGSCKLILTVVGIYGSDKLAVHGIGEVGGGAGALFCKNVLDAVEYVDIYVGKELFKILVCAIADGAPIATESSDRAKSLIRFITDSFSLTIKYSTAIFTTYVPNELIFIAR